MAPARVRHGALGEGGEIPDGKGGGVSSSIEFIAQNFVVAFVAVAIEGLQHGRAGDLSITLTNDTTGTTVTLLERPGVPEDAFGDDADFAGDYFWNEDGTVYDVDTYDEVVPDRALFAPLGDGFVAFRDELGNGTWTLNVVDHAVGETGVFSAWALRVYSTRSCVGDLSGNGIDFEDILRLLDAWGPCFACSSDFDGNGRTGFEDIIQILSVWGTICYQEGACCYLDRGVEAYVCVLLSDSDCRARSGRYSGDDTTCTSQPCLGACCFEDTGECKVLEPFECEAAGGTFLGDGAECSVEACPPPK